ncbi:MAG TPA: cytochrome c peroxidase [Sphingobium sp.]
MALAGLALAAAAPVSWRWPTPPVPQDNPMTADKVALGRRLFYDADLSINGTMACSACHEQKRGFTDGNATRPGVHGDPGLRNVPGLANVAWRKRLTWADAALTRLEDQVGIPLFGDHPVEMGMKGQEAELGRRLGKDACYRAMFAKAFPEKKGRIDATAVSAALAAFERTMISFGSPYDHFLAGKESTLSPAARRGYAVFSARGCLSCHGGRDLTDDALHAILPGAPADRGLMEKTGLSADRDHFRTPSLRNVAVTGPYLHDGSAATMAEAIRRHAIPPATGPLTDVQMTGSQMADMTAFLDSLTDPAFLSDQRLSMPARACGRPL